MRSSRDFEGLAVWQRSKAIAVEVCRASKSCKNWGFRDQIMRSAVSVPSNIAEGAERNGTKEFIQFLGIAKGSLGELRTQVMIGLELEYFDETIAKQWITESREISKMLHGLIRSLRDS
ncbi:four helix bundle protein [Verrucomicrobiaceae bacterium 227]